MTISTDKLQITKTIHAMRDDVFNEWMNPRYVQRWFCPEDMHVMLSKWEAKPGGEYRLSMVNEKDEHFTTYGTFKELIPNQKIVMTFGWEGPDRVETLLTAEFKDKSDGTEVTLTHEKFIDPDEVKEHAKGWASALENLEKQFNLEKVD